MKLCTYSYFVQTRTVMIPRFYFTSSYYAQSSIFLSRFSLIKRLSRNIHIPSLPIYNINTTAAASEIIKRLVFTPSGKKCDQTSPLTLPRAAFLHLNNHSQRFGVIAVLQSDFGLVIFHLDEKSVILPLLEFFNSDQILKICISLPDLGLSLQRCSTQAINFKPQNCLDLHIAHELLHGSSPLHLSELFAVFVKQTQPADLKNITLAASSHEMIRFQLEAIHVNRPALKAMTEYWRLKELKRRSKKGNAKRSIEETHISQRSENQPSNETYYNIIGNVLHQMTLSVDSIAASLKSGLNTAINKGCQRVELFRSLSSVTYKKETIIEGVFMHRHERLSYFAINGSHNGCLAIVEDAPKSIQNSEIKSLLSVEQVNKQKIIHAMPLVEKNECENNSREDLEYITLKEAQKRREILKGRNEKVKLTKPINLQDYEEEELDLDDEANMPQIDLDDPAELPGGRTRLPRLGELIYRRGKKPKPRKKLPRNFYDHDGTILPVQPAHRSN